MIAYVRGRVAALAPTGVVVEVGGVGLSLECTPTTIAGLRVGEEALLASSLVVREDSLTLYGFGSDDEKATFEVLQTASGVGPRLAQAMLAVHSPDALRRAVAVDDLVALMLVPGIGKKGAQRIVLELRDRLGAPTGAVQRPRPAAPPAWREQLLGALLGLGWSTREAEDALVAVEPEAEALLAAGAQPGGTEQMVATLLRTALRTLSRV